MKKVICLTIALVALLSCCVAVAVSEKGESGLFWDVYVPLVRRDVPHGLEQVEAFLAGTEYLFEEMEDLSWGYLVYVEGHKEDGYVFLSFDPETYIEERSLTAISFLSEQMNIEISWGNLYFDYVKPPERDFLSMRVRGKEKIEDVTVDDQIGFYLENAGKESV